MCVEAFTDYPPLGRYLLLDSASLVSQLNLRLKLNCISRSHFESRLPKKWAITTAESISKTTTPACGYNFNRSRFSFFRFTSIHVFLFSFLFSSATCTTFACLTSLLTRDTTVICITIKGWYNNFFSLILQEIIIIFQLN